MGRKRSLWQNIRVHIDPIGSKLCTLCKDKEAVGTVRMPNGKFVKACRTCRSSMGGISGQKWK